MQKWKNSETMATIIQTHLIIEPNWAEVTKKESRTHYLEM